MSDSSAKTKPKFVIDDDELEALKEVCESALLFDGYWAGFAENLITRIKEYKEPQKVKIEEPRKDGLIVCEDCGEAKHPTTFVTNKAYGDPERNRCGRCYLRGYD